MDIASFITYSPSWILFLLTISIGIVAAEFGAWVSVRKIKYELTGREGPIGSLVGATLGLLAFMLGFTFSITSTRYGVRREMVVLEAQAITDCYLRTDLIPENQKNESRRLLTEYTDILLETKNPSELDQAISKLEKLNLQIWSQAASLARENMDSELRSLYVKSASEVVDTFHKRKTVALIYRIPSAIWGTLFLLFILSMFLVGYEIGDYKRRRVLNTPLMATAFALIVVLIADMDSSTHSKNFKANLQPFKDTQKVIREYKS